MNTSNGSKSVGKRLIEAIWKNKEAELDDLLRAPTTREEAISILASKSIPHPNPNNHPTSNLLETAFLKGSSSVILKVIHLCLEIVNPVEKKKVFEAAFVWLPESLGNALAAYVVAQTPSHKTSLENHIFMYGIKKMLEDKRDQLLKEQAELTTYQGSTVDKVRRFMPNVLETIDSFRLSSSKRSEAIDTYCVDLMESQKKIYDYCIKQYQMILAVFEQGIPGSRVLEQTYMYLSSLKAFFDAYYEDMESCAQPVNFVSASRIVENEIKNKKRLNKSGNIYVADSEYKFVHTLLTGLDGFLAPGSRVWLSILEYRSAGSRIITHPERYQFVATKEDLLKLSKEIINLKLNNRLNHLKLEEIDRDGAKLMVEYIVFTYENLLFRSSQTGGDQFSTISELEEQREKFDSLYRFNQRIVEIYARLEEMSHEFSEEVQTSEVIESQSVDSVSKSSAALSTPSVSSSSSSHQSSDTKLKDERQVFVANSRPASVRKKEDRKEFPENVAELLQKRKAAIQAYRIEREYIKKARAAAASLSHQLKRTQTHTSPGRDLITAFQSHVDENLQSEATLAMILEKLNELAKTKNIQNDALSELLITLGFEGRELAKSRGGMIWGYPGVADTTFNYHAPHGKSSDFVAGGTFTVHRDSIRELLDIIEMGNIINILREKITTLRVKNSAAGSAVNPPVMTQHYDSYCANGAGIAPGISHSLSSTSSHSSQQKAFGSKLT